MTPGANGDRRGFTLMELMVVLAIIGLVSGMSLGVYRKIASQNLLPTSASQASSVLRAARNYSVSAALPSRVYLDAEKGRISAFGYEVIAGWSFEDLETEEVGSRIERGKELFGAFREPAEVQGEIEVMAGRIGRGILLLDEGASLVAPRRPRYDSPRGFSLEAWVLFYQRPLEKGEGSDRTGAWNDPRRSEQYAVVSRPGSYEFGLLGDGSLYAVIGDGDRLESDSTFVAATRSAEVLPVRWTHVRASYDGIELTLEVDGIARRWAPVGFERIDERDWPELPPEVPPSDADLMISHPNRFFFGGIDEVKIRIAREPKTFELPDEVVFLGRSRLIRFDSRGGLDPIHHSNPVVVRIGELGEDAPVEDPQRGTDVAAPTLDEQSEIDRARAEEQAEELLGDPIAALSQYLEEQRLAADEESAGDDAGDDPDARMLAPGEGDPDAETRSRGIRRVHQIIVDLTGTIRG